MIKEKTFSLYKLIEEYVGDRDPFDYPIEANMDSFYVVKDKNPKYVQPFLKELYSNCGQENPQILCVAATGASGKSVMADFISAEKQCPVFSLGNHAAVASSAMVGVLFDSLGAQNISPFLGSLQKGKSLVIIDGADEGMVKAGNFEAFKTFLKGIADMAVKSDKTTFIILGRISAMEIVHLVLEEFGVKSKCVKIEAFTENQAKDFINKNTGKNESDGAYTKLRDYILESVGDIFKDQHDIKTSDYQKFIGYAPVLMAISKLIVEETNPYRLYQEISRQGVKNVDLIITIVESILERDRENKIKPFVLEKLVASRDEHFQQQVFDQVYSNTEQCYRVLAKAMGRDLTLSVTGDLEFDMKYEEQIKGWMEDHPFYDLDKRRIQNSVFESYIIAKLIVFSEYKPLVLQYLMSRYKDAFILFYIYDALMKDKKHIDIEFLPYLIASAHSLDDNEYKVEVHLEEEEIRERSTLCQMTVRGFDKDYNFELEVPNSQPLYIGDNISNSFIIVPSLGFELNRLQSSLTAPITIQCVTLFTQASDFHIVYSADKSNGSVVIDCENVVTDFSNGRQYRFYVGDGDDPLKLFSSNSPGYPFSTFWKDFGQIEGLNEVQLRVYQKLRITISLFKSHSKGRLAKYKDKIDNKRWLGSDEWRFLLNALLDKGVLYVEDNFYFISPENLSNCLGMSYDQLRCGEVTPKTVSFIKEIKP